MTRARPAAFLLLALLVISASACVSSPPASDLHQLGKAPKSICRIAVLPFVNQTDFQQGDVLVQRVFVAELNRRGGFTVAQEGDVRRVLRQMKVGPKETPGYEQTLVLADRLAVDAVISGEVIAMHEGQESKETDPLLAVDLKLTPVGASKPWLTIYHRRRGEDYRKVMHFGLVNTMTALAVIVADEILDTWFAKGLTPCAS